MNNSKKTLKVVIIFVVLLVIAIAGVAYTYFFTDVFKSEKQKFFKYMIKDLENVSSLKSEELINYYEKKNTQVYKNSGEFYTDVDEKIASKYMPNKKVYNEVKDFKIVFNGEKDLANNYEHDVFSLKYSNNEKMTFEFLRVDEYFGLKVDTILNKYLVLENNNLKEFAKKIGIDNTDSIPNKIELKDYSKYMFSEEELKLLKEKIYKILDENLNDSMFREEKTDNYSKYTLTLTNAQINDIVLKIYTSLINDENIIEKVRSMAISELGMTEQEANAEIERLKKNIDEFIEDEKSNMSEDSQKDKSKDTDLVYISVFNNKTNSPNFEIINNKQKISFELNERKLSIIVNAATLDGDKTVYNPIASIYLQKKFNNNTLEYEFSVSTINSIADNTWSGTLSFEGIQNSNSVKEALLLNSKMTKEDDVKNDIKYYFNNNVEFSDIEKIDIKSNGVRINNYNEEKMKSTLERLAGSIDNLNKKQMQSLGLATNQNPILYMTPYLVPFIGANNVIQSTQTKTHEILLGQLKETIYLELEDIKVNYYIEQSLNSGNIKSLDDYIDAKLSDLNTLNKINKEIESLKYVAKFDKNVGIIFTSIDGTETIICKIQNGSTNWDN